MYIVKVAYDFVWIAIIIHCTNARKITNCHCFFQSPFYLLFPAFQTPFWIIQELMIDCWNSEPDLQRSLYNVSEFITNHHSVSLYAWRTTTSIVSTQTNKNANQIIYLRLNQVLQIRRLCIIFISETIFFFVGPFDWQPSSVLARSPSVQVQQTLCFAFVFLILKSIA